MLHNAIEKAHLEESRDAIIGMTGEGKVLYWSKGAEATFGYSRMEAEGRDLVELVVPGDRIEEERRIVAEAREKGIKCNRRYGGIGDAVLVRPRGRRRSAYDWGQFTAADDR